MLDIIHISKFILTISCNLLTRESLNDNCAPGSGPGVGFTAQMLLSLFLHCLIKYDLGIRSTIIDNSWMNSSTTK